MSETTVRDVQMVPVLRRRLTALKALLSRTPEVVVPWIGAGLSVPCGYPTWGRFLGDLAAELGAAERATAEALVRMGRFDLAADFITGLAGVDFARAMINCFGRAPGAPPRSTALRKLGCRYFVTTNYDRVLEEMMPWLIPLTPSTYRHQAFRHRHTLLKLHGTIEDPDTWVLTRQQYGRHYNRRLESELQSFFREKTVLFLGCSLLGDEYLETLSRLRPDERGRHFAFLPTASNEEALSKGAVLERLGVDLIPYATDGTHDFLYEVLNYLVPSSQSLADRIEEALSRDDAERALLLLRPWVEQSGEPQSRRAVAALTATTAERLLAADAAASKEELLQLTAAAAALDGESIQVLEARIEVLERFGEASVRERSRLPELRRAREVRLRQQRHRRHASLSERWHASDRPPIRQAYRAYRSADIEDFRRWVRAIRADGPIRKAELTGRLSVLAMRAELQALHPLDSRVEQPIPGVSTEAEQVEPLLHALRAYHASDYTVAIRALDALDSRWRAASGGGGGLGFSLQLRALCLLGAGDLGAAREAILACQRTYTEPQWTLIRKFAYGAALPAELAFDVRALGSPELFALIEFWEMLAAACASPGSIGTGQVELLQREMNRWSENDVLLATLEPLCAALALGSDGYAPGITSRRLARQVRELKRRAPGLLPDLAIVTRVMWAAGLGPPWLEAVAAEVDEAIRTPP